MTSDNRTTDAPPNSPRSLDAQGFGGGKRFDPEFLAALAEKLHSIAADTPDLTRQHVNFCGEIRRKATVVQVAANILAALSPLPPPRS